MPVEIRELVIRAVTTTEAKDSQDEPQAQAAGNDQEVIIQECVRQVLRILQKNKER
jgi:hypothetical protein